MKGPFARHLQESHVTNPARASLSLLFLRAVAGNWKLSLWLPFAGSSLAVRKHTVLGHNCKRYSGVAVACLCRVRSQWVGSSWYILPVFCGSFHEALGPVCALGRGGPLPGNYASKARAKATAHAIGKEYYAWSWIWLGSADVVGIPDRYFERGPSILSARYTLLCAQTRSSSQVGRRGIFL